MRRLFRDKYIVETSEVAELTNAIADLNALNHRLRREVFQLTNRTTFIEPLDRCLTQCVYPWKAYLADKKSSKQPGVHAQIIHQRLVENYREIKQTAGKFKELDELRHGLAKAEFVFRTYLDDKAIPPVERTNAIGPTMEHSLEQRSDDRMESLHESESRLAEIMNAIQESGIQFGAQDPVDRLSSAVHALMSKAAYSAEELSRIPSLEKEIESQKQQIEQEQRFVESIDKAHSKLSRENARLILEVENLQKRSPGSVLGNEEQKKILEEINGLKRKVASLHATLVDADVAKDRLTKDIADLVALSKSRSETIETLQNELRQATEEATRVRKDATRVHELEIEVEYLKRQIETNSQEYSNSLAELLSRQATAQEPESPGVLGENLVVEDSAEERSPDVITQVEQTPLRRARRI